MKSEEEDHRQLHKSNLLSEDFILFLVLREREYERSYIPMPAKGMKSTSEPLDLEPPVVLEVGAGN